MKHRISILFLVVVTLLLFFFFRENNYFFIYEILLLSFFGFLVFLGTTQIEFNYFVKSINKGENGISITFDDTPDSELTPQFLDVLEKYKLKATFFCIGEKVKSNHNIIKEIHQKGHILGNHSFSHKINLPLISTEKLIEDIEQCNSILKEIIGSSPLFFRPPFGVTTPRYERAIKQLKMLSIGWSLRSFDTVENNTEKLLIKLKKKVKNGDIILFHDTQKVTLEVLPKFIEYCQENGIKIVSLPDLINKQPYA